MIDNIVAQKKYKLINDFILNDNDTKKFKDFDNKLMIKRFELAKEFSFIEQILTLDDIHIKIKELKNTVEKFLGAPKITKESLFDIIKFSNFSSSKISEVLSPVQQLKLCEKLENVSRETQQINIDFSILKILDNLILKTNNPSIKKTYKNTKIKITNKLVSFNYIHQEKENDYVYMCWIDKVLSMVMQREISVYDFIKICQKIINISQENLDIYWRILHTVNYIYFHANFYHIKELRKFKRNILKDIKLLNNSKSIYKSNIESLLINILAQPSINKEDFYYLFISIKKLVEKSTEDKSFCLIIIEYLIYRNSKQSIFKNRFVREAFCNMYSSLLKDNDAPEIKEKELLILFKLYHIDSFFFYHKKDIISAISQLICNISNQNKKLIGSKFYKYCDMADFIFANNRDIIPITFNKNLENFDKFCKRTYKHFNLYLS